MNVSKSQGVLDIEISAFERECNVIFPSAYREFLRKYGISGVMKGADYEFHKLHDVKEWSDELICENGVDISWLGSFFVFAIHQGYQIFLFQLGVGDDPIVYSYTEGDKGISSVGMRFSEFVAAYIREESTPKTRS